MGRIRQYFSFKSKGLFEGTQKALALLIVFSQIVAPIGPVFNLGQAFAAGSASLEQCRNGTITSPANCEVLSGNTGWVNGNAGGSNSHWREGDSLPYRMLTDGLVVNESYELTIAWDTTKSSKHAIDYLTSYDRTEKTADPCSGVVDCGSPSTSTIPVDSQVANAGITQEPGEFTVFGGTITNVGSYSYPNGSGFAGDKSAQITVTFTADTVNPVMAWGGHIASQIDWSFGNSASAINGSPYHTSLVALNDSQGNAISQGSQDRSLSADAVFPTPDMSTQVSASEIAVGQSVTDLATLDGPSNNSPEVTGTIAFFVCGPAEVNPDCTGGGTKVGGDVTVVNEEATSTPFTPTLEGSYCFRAEYTPSVDSPYSPQNHTNLTTECFTANPAPGSITIIKDAQPGSDQIFNFSATGPVASSFTLQDNGDETDGEGKLKEKKFNELLPDTYTFTEETEALPAWDLFDLTCSDYEDSLVTINKDDKKVTIELAAGENVKCTFINQQRGTVTVTKEIVGINANDQTFDFTTDVPGLDLSGGLVAGEDESTADNAVVPGPYSVTELVPAGWDLTDISCVEQGGIENSTGMGITATIVVEAGEAVHCTFTNTELGKITVEKEIETTAETAEFEFEFDGNVDELDGGIVGEGSFDSGKTLSPGDYTIEELLAANSGWDLTNITCTGETFTQDDIDAKTATVDLSAGEEVTCTFTNTERGSISGTKYESNLGDTEGAQGNELDGWTIFIDKDGGGELDDDEISTLTDTNGSFAFTNLVPGTYTICEVVETGWSQVFPTGPDCHEVTVDAGQTVDNIDFGNFQNGAITGFKYEDRNTPDEDGYGVFNAGTESKILNWEFTLIKDADGGGELDTDDTLIGTSETGDDGDNYIFNNLSPGTYFVCEEDKSEDGWVNTDPGNDGLCKTLILTSSGDTLHANFGNRPVGTITVVKLLDEDGDGKVDDWNADWEWQIDGGEALSTVNDTNVEVTANNDTYTVSEVLMDDFHSTSVSCDGEETITGESATSINVTLYPGEDVTCYFTNARDTGTVIIEKEVITTQEDLFETFTFTSAIGELAGDIEFAGSTTPEGNLSLTLPTGTYLSTEAEKEGWDLTAIKCVETGGENLTESQELLEFRSAEFNLDKDETITCTFTNTQHGKVVLEKKVETTQEDVTQEFKFTSNINSLDGATITGAGSAESDLIVPGTYSISEDVPAGWDLTSATCDDQSSPNEISLQAGETVTCTFVNTQRSEVVVTKFQDLYLDQEYNEEPQEGQDVGDPLLEGWTIFLNENSQNEHAGVTNSAGQHTFEVPAGSYGLSEDLESQEGDWNLSTIYCEEIERGGLDGEVFFFNLDPGQELNCFLGNYQDLLLELDKENDQTAPQQVGESIVYTLEVSVPENSGTSFNTVVTDLPPEGIEYINNSWTAELNRNGATTDLRANGTVTEPTYASPGNWSIGIMLPGDVITLTYRTLITDNVTPGEYPDLAFATGNQIPSDINTVVYSNVAPESETGTPFVGTAVQVVDESETVAVFAAAETVTRLPNTGPAWLDAIFVPVALASLYYMFARRKWYKQIGGRI